MKLPRFRIAWLMGFIAVAAINFAALRLALDEPTGHGELLAIGGAPMLSILVIGFLVGRRRQGSGPFLWGFELFGGAALGLFVFLAVFFDVAVMTYLVAPILEPIAKVIGYQSLAWLPIAYPIAVVLLAWPQVAFALLGGWLSRRYKVTIARR